MIQAHRCCRSFKISVLTALILVFVSGCSSSNDLPPPSSNETISEALTRLEASGASPTLDRSTSISGPDVNGDGVRDDIEAYIESLPDSPSQKASLRQSSRAIRDAMRIGSGPPGDPGLRNTMTEIGNAVNCVWMVYSQEVAGGKVQEIRKYTANTPERFKAYDKYSRMVSGFAVRLPKGDTCENP